ncbi:MAG TPA: hypothetical protein VE467_01795 [Chryseolinea sp.]|jgi:glucan-binding YG repeat protein|nr:hypothetical protein [Chryseolinea sp.]
MKKIMLTLCGAAIISFATFAQTQDSTSSPNNNRNSVEQSQDPATQDADQTPPPPQGGADRDGTNAIPQGQSRESGQPTENQTDQTMERPNEIVPVEGKEGPNGEAIFMENGKYYFMNEAGEKKKIKASKLRDKTQ